MDCKARTGQPVLSSIPIHLCAVSLENPDRPKLSREFTRIEMCEREKFRVYQLNIKIRAVFRDWHKHCRRYLQQPAASGSQGGNSNVREIILDSLGSNVNSVCAAIRNGISDTGRRGGIRIPCFWNNFSWNDWCATELR